MAWAKGASASRAVPTQDRAVQLAVFSGRDDHQVLKTVVVPPVVQVMDLFIGVQVPIEMSLHHEAVLQHVPATASVPFKDVAV